MNREQQESLFESLFAHANESIIVSGANGEIILANPAAEMLFGYSKEEMAGKPVEMLMPGTLARQHEKHRQSYYANPHARAMGAGLDLRAMKKDGMEFPVEISLSPFKSGNEFFVIAFIIDISNRKRAEKEIALQHQKLEELAMQLKASNEKLESKVHDRTRVLSEALNEIEKSREELSKALEREKELNELKSRFISMASHEFRTPLTAILSSASLIEEYKTSEQHDKREKHVNRIKSAVNNLNDILSDFLSISKIEEGKVLADFNEFKLNDLIADTCSEMKSIVKAGQRIECNCDEGITIKSDRKLLRNCLVNLLSNAIKFSDENKIIKVNSEVAGGYAKIIVTDQGIGISREDQKHLFERFFRGRNATNIQGTGLGLHIVASHLELLNGFIEVESELQKGTVITITIPSGT